MTSLSKTTLTGMKRLPSATICLAELTAMLSACAVLFWNASPAISQSGAMTIGAILPLTGDAAHWGIPPRDGAELAVEEINNAGGVSGRKLALAIENDRCQPAEGVAAFNRLMAANLHAILGAVCSGVTLAIAPQAEAQKVVLISPASTSPKVTDAGDFIFRVIPSGSLRGKIFAEYVFNDRGLRKLAVLYINNEGGIGGATAFKSRFTQLGGMIVFEEGYPPGTTDLRAQLAKIKASNADGILVGSYPPDTVVVLKQARELMLRLPMFLTTEAVQNPDVLRDTGDAANGAVYILAAPPTGASSEKFSNAFEARFKRPPELFAAEGYDIVRLVRDAVVATKGAPFGGPALRDYLYGVRDYPGASGIITFDKNGDVVKPYAIKTIDGGKPVTIVIK
jgi:branched-chain amino acid transport system substrate-binding protein